MLHVLSLSLGITFLSYFENSCSVFVIEKAIPGETRISLDSEEKQTSQNSK